MTKASFPACWRILVPWLQEKDMSYRKLKTKVNWRATHKSRQSSLTRLSATMAEYGLHGDSVIGWCWGAKWDFLAVTPTKTTAGAEPASSFCWASLFDHPGKESCFERPRKNQRKRNFDLVVASVLQASRLLKAGPVLKIEQGRKGKSGSWIQIWIS